MKQKTAIEGAMTEIGAGRCLFPKTEVDRMWNEATNRALRILERYKNGEGLFQAASAQPKAQGSDNG
jgi:hypothetical protein